MIRDRIHLAWCLCVLGGLALAGSGCSSGFNNAPVDAALARETLQKAFESWKKGEQVDALQQASPPIYMIAMEDWRSGASLKDYEILGPGEEKDAHLVCQVKLTIRGPGGKETKSQQTFMISTAPNLTVSRKVF